MPERAGYIRLDEILSRLTVDIANPEVGEDDPAVLAWRKRELAIGLLYSAFRDAALAAVVRTTSGALIPLVDSDWKNAIFWRDIIIGGVWRDDTEPYDRGHVLIEAKLFDSWLKARPRPPQPEPNEALCIEWLESEMRASRERRPHAKKHYCKQAAERFRISARHFNNVIWPNAIRNTGVTKWSRPGPQ